MMNTPEDMLREAFGNISTQCQRMSESAMAMDAEKVERSYEALKRAIGFLYIIDRIAKRTA